MEKKESYIKTLEKTIEAQVLLLSCLEKRVSLLDESNDDSPYEANEKQILIIKTKAEIGSLRQIVKEKQDYFVKFCESFDAEYQVMENNYDKLMDTAYDLAKSNETLNLLLNAHNIDEIEADKEMKLMFYKRVFSLVYG